MNVARVGATFSIADSEQIAVTFHVKAADSHDPIDEAARSALGQAVTLWWNSDGGGFGATKSRYTTALALQEVVVQTVQPADEALTVTPGESEPGTLDVVHFELQSYMFPPQCCWLLTLDTAEVSRSGRGRIYLPASFSFHVFCDLLSIDPHTEDLPAQEPFALGLIPPAIRQDVANIGAHLAYEIAHAPGYDEFDFVLAVYSRLHETAHAVSNFRVAQHLRTQRRRTISPSAHDLYDLTGDPA